jgi:hypothetical protein
MRNLERVALLAAIALAACEVKVKDSGELPKVDIEPGKMPDVEVSTDSVKMPDIHAPKIETPDVKLPEVKTPHIEAPKIDLPGDDDRARTDTTRRH